MAKITLDTEKNINSIMYLIDKLAEQQIPLLESMIKTTIEAWKSIAVDGILQNLDDYDCTDATLSNLKVVIKKEILPDHSIEAVRNLYSQLNRKDIRIYQPIGNKEVSGEGFFPETLAGSVFQQEAAAYPRYILDKMMALGDITSQQYEKMVRKVHKKDKTK